MKEFQVEVVSSDGWTEDAIRNCLNSQCPLKVKRDESLDSRIDEPASVGDPLCAALANVATNGKEESLGVG